MEEQTLYSLAVEFFGDLKRLQSDMDRAKVQAMAGGERIGQSLADGLRRELGGQFGGGGLVGNLLFGSSDLLRGAAAGRGALALIGFSSNAGSEMATFRRQLQGIAGDAGKAEKALTELQDLAGSTNYDTNQVLPLGIRLAAKQNSVTGIAGQIGRQLDAAQAFGIAPKDFGEYQRNLTQMFNRGGSKVDQQDYQEFINRAPLAVSAIAKALGISATDADKKLRGATGDQMKALVDQVGKANAGAAQNAGAVDPQSAMRQVVDNVTSGLAPTGEAFNRAAMPVMRFLVEASTQFRNFNRVTGGQAGLIGILGLAYVGVTGLTRGLITTIVSINTLTASLTRLAATSEVAAVGGGSAAAGLSVSFLARLMTFLRGAAVPVATGLLRTNEGGIGDVVQNMVAKAIGEKKQEKAADKMADAVDQFANTVDLFKVGVKDIGLGERGASAANLAAREYMAWHINKARTLGVG